MVRRNEVEAGTGMTDALWSLITRPWALRGDTLAGVSLLLVLAALLGEAAWRLVRWPRLVGYTLAGLVLAVTNTGARGHEPVLRMAIDLALALLLFEAGARLNLRWLRRNPRLLATSVLEALLSGSLVYVVARELGLDARAAGGLAAVLVGVSPAVVLRVVGESDAAGQVTERVIALSTLNTLYALLATRLLTTGLVLGDPSSWNSSLLPTVVGFLGSLLLGAALGSVVLGIARRLDLRDENPVVLLLGCVLLALVIAKTLQLSTLLVPLLAGLWLRNRSERPWVWPRQFGTAGGVLMLVLFVAVASAGTPAVWLGAGTLAAALVGVRLLGKAAAVALLARPSGLSWRQAAGLSAGLLPLSATAWVLALEFSAVHPGPGAALMPPMLAAIALLELPAPLLLLYALRWVGETDAHTR
jgi:Kef-type K+ transport system membrane component KefB